MLRFQINSSNLSSLIQESRTHDVKIESVTHTFLNDQITSKTTISRDIYGRIGRKILNLIFYYTFNNSEFYTQFELFRP